MSGGELRRRVTLQRRVETRNATGETVWSWQDVETVFARIRSLTARERFMGMQVASEVTVELKIRRCPHVTAKMRAVEYGADSPPTPTYYDITDVLPDERRTYFLLPCIVRAADGWRG